MPRTTDSYNRLIFNGFQKKIQFRGNKDLWRFLTVLCNRRVKEWQVTTDRTETWGHLGY